jgi:hypothetical protein
MNKTVTVTVNQRFNISPTQDISDAIVVAKGDILKVKHHGIINKEEYVELPSICSPNRILLESAIMDGWVKVNN